MDNLQLIASPEFDGFREIALCELPGFTEDKASLRAFERRFLPFSVPPLLFMFGSFILIICHEMGLTSHEWIPYWKEGEVLPGIDVVHFFLYWVAAGIAFVAVAFWMTKAKPISKISGKPMVSFRRTDAPPGVLEMIYVDLQSRTYFRRVIAIARSGRFGERPALFWPR